MSKEFSVQDSVAGIRTVIFSPIGLPPEFSGIEESVLRKDRGKTIFISKKISYSVLLAGGKRGIMNELYLAFIKGIEDYMIKYKVDLFNLISVAQKGMLTIS